MRLHARVPASTELAGLGTAGANAFECSRRGLRRHSPRLRTRQRRRGNRDGWPRGLPN